MTTSAEWFGRPVINVSNVEASIRFYVDKLGFQLDWHFGEPISVCEVWRGKVQLILCEHFQEKAGKSLQFISFDAGSRDAEIAAVDSFRAEIEGRGATVREGRWGYRVLVIDDPDGNQIFVPYPNEPGQPPT
jgi:catechol 2,3-dioxygenase-like lactoylglutathione lyase family enzyme